MKKIQSTFVVPVALALAFAAGQAQALVIDFDTQGLNGPSLFNSAPTGAQMLSIDIGTYTVTFTGGRVLTQATNMPVNQTSIYGTADFALGGGYTNPLSIQFFDIGTNTPKPITNFFLDVLNGNTVNVDYALSDNAGNSALFNLIPNLSGGLKQVGFAAAGDTITVFGTPPIDGCCQWDFFVDNIHFNEALPTVPEPGSIALLGLGLVGLAFRRRKQPA
jgi:hypothetical protein